MGRNSAYGNVFWGTWVVWGNHTADINYSELDFWWITFFILTIFNVVQMFVLFWKRMHSWIASSLWSQWRCRVRNWVVSVEIPWSLSRCYKRTCGFGHLDQLDWSPPRDWTGSRVRLILNIEIPKENGTGKDLNWKNEVCALSFSRRKSVVLPRRSILHWFIFSL